MIIFAVIVNHLVAVLPHSFVNGIYYLSHPVSIANLSNGDVMEYVGWIVSGGSKLSLTASYGIDKTIGFALADSILINYESVMYIK